ncbi:hypothetical protein NDU88_010141 [Pleurodeles waltl]|uniref:Uncharacterized protein n=1 Tax=Pleurodeles waltl TaxID=8319 RepID=A0AAV7S1S0_PLEWA|nr:hypothetical protein NDU88_010141 [Pleurodeles waltl]
MKDNRTCPRILVLKDGRNCGPYTEDVLFNVQSDPAVLLHVHQQLGRHSVVRFIFNSSAACASAGQEPVLAH